VVLSFPSATFAQKIDMAYQSRKKYKSRREKNQTAKKNAKIILFFLSLGTLVWLILYRVSLWDWVRIKFFYN
jgi:hypothetical protein